MNSALGDLHHQQEFHWVRRIRCAKNRTSGTGEVMLGNSGTSPCTGDPRDQVSSQPGAHKPSNALPCVLCLFKFSSPPECQQPQHSRTPHKNTKTKLKFTTMLIGFDVLICRNTQTSHKTRAEPPCAVPDPQR